MRHRTVIALAVLLCAPACEQDHNTPAQTHPVPATPQPVKAAASAATVTPSAAASAPAPSASAQSASDVTEIAITSVGETMRFDKTELTVKQGAHVHLVLHNSSKSPLLPHNWALVRPGTEAAVALAGLNKGEAAGFVDPSPDVLAYTPLAAAQQTVEITFTAPSAGTYPYICTVPGHYLMMKGTLTVTPN